MLGKIFYKKFKSKKPKDLFWRFYYYFLGVPDFHSHIRYRNVKSYFLPVKNTIEIGSGEGLMGMQYVQEFGGTLVSTEINKDVCDNNRNFVKMVGLKNITFLPISAQLIKKIFNKEKFDQCFAFDVLEHIDNDEEILKNINSILKKNGRLIISVPTPWHILYYGKEHYKETGHVRDGYFIEDIKKKLEIAGFNLIDYHYHSFYLISKIVFLWYQKWRHNKFMGYVKILLNPLFQIISYFDFLSNKEFPCHLVVVALKKIKL